MSESLTLYDLETGLAEAAERVVELQSQASHAPEDMEQALQILEEYITESAQKRTKVGKFLETLTASAVSIDDEIERLQARKKRILQTHDQMCNYILLIMSRLGVTKLESPLFSFKARKNPPSVAITDPVALPPEYLRQPDPPAPVPDKKLIKEDLQRGVEIPGACLHQSTRLVIDN